MSACVWCNKDTGVDPSWEYCNIACVIDEAYQRGRDEERAAVVAYLRSPRIGCTFEADEVEKSEHEVKR